MKELARVNELPTKSARTGRFSGLLFLFASGFVSGGRVFRRRGFRRVFGRRGFCRAFHRRAVALAAH